MKGRFLSGLEDFFVDRALFGGNHLLSRRLEIKQECQLFDRLLTGVTNTAVHRDFGFASMGRGFENFQVRRLLFLVRRNRSDNQRQCQDDPKRFHVNL